LAGQPRKAADSTEHHLRPAVLSEFPSPDHSRATAHKLKCNLSRAAHPPYGNCPDSQVVQPLPSAGIGALLLLMAVTMDLSVIAIITTPVIYVYLDRLQQMFRGRRSPALEAASSSTVACNGFAILQGTVGLTANLSIKTPF
jgi:hypothetical protein